ncbi:MAG: DUF5658 family protein [Gammaproteobacteria bacterium]|nr:DUF5658 family protein [Gammaproteobacteria bacterium]
MNSELLRQGASPATVTFNEYRSSTDRRQSTSNSSYYWFFGRRKTIRREQDKHNQLVDIPATNHVLMAISIMILSVTDAFLTLNILATGGIEVNPLLDVVVQKDIQLFTYTKLALTGLCIIFLTRYIHFRLFNLFSVARFMQLTLTGYTMLISYQVVILSSQLL